MTYLAKMTETMSNSDLKELCRNAVMVPVREAIRAATDTNSKGVSKVDVKSLKVRAIRMSDFAQFVSGGGNFTVPEPVD